MYQYKFEKRLNNEPLYFYICFLWHIKSRLFSLQILFPREVVKTRKINEQYIIFLFICLEITVQNGVRYQPPKILKTFTFDFHKR